MPPTPTGTESRLARFLASDLVAAMTAPHGVDRYLEIVNPMLAVHEARARIVAVRPETSAGATVATVTLQPTSTWRGFRAGQHVQLGVEVDGARRTTRAFSISSAQGGPGERFTLTLRANPDGVVSRFLTERAQPGQLVHLSQAEGDFTLPDVLPAHLLMISGGSGITPVMSMLRTLLARGYDGTVTFLHYAQSPEHQIFADELAEISGRPGVEVRLVYPELDGEYFSAERLAALVPDYADVDTWACGPAGLIERVQEAYADSDRLRVEYFKIPTTATGSGEGDVSFSRSGASAPNTGTTLLEQAEALGLRPEYGCRMGICFSCTARKEAGTVRNVISGAESSSPDEDIQICVSAPLGDCTVAL